MDPSIFVAGISALAAIGAAILAYRSSGRATDVNEQAAQLKWVQDMRQDATETRKEMDGLQEQVRTLRRQLDTVTREADHWIAAYQLVHRTAWRTGMTLDRVRELLGPEAPTANGRPTP